VSGRVWGWGKVGKNGKRIINDDVPRERPHPGPKRLETIKVGDGLIPQKKKGKEGEGKGNACGYGRDAYTDIQKDRGTKTPDGSRKKNGGESGQKEKGVLKQGKTPETNQTNQQRLPRVSSSFPMAGTGQGKTGGGQTKVKKKEGTENNVGVQTRVIYKAKHI